MEQAATSAGLCCRKPGSRYPRIVIPDAHCSSLQVLTATRHRIYGRSSDCATARVLVSGRERGREREKHTSSARTNGHYHESKQRVEHTVLGNWNSPKPCSVARRTGVHSARAKQRLTNARIAHGISSPQICESVSGSKTESTQ